MIAETTYLLMIKPPPKVVSLRRRVFVVSFKHSVPGAEWSVSLW